MAERGEVNLQETEHFEAESLINREKDAWKEVLGVEVEVPPLPSFLDDGVINGFRHLGFEIRYIPGIKGKKHDYSDDDKNPFEGYPNWKPVDLSSGSQQQFKNFPSEAIRHSQFLIPAREWGGYWVAVETIPKPNWDEHYQDTLLLKGVARENVLIPEIRKVLKKIRVKISGVVNIPDNATLRLPALFEWNLLGNREGWGDTTSSEWTDTTAQIDLNFFGPSGDYNTMVAIIGDSREGGVVQTDDEDVNNMGWGAKIFKEFISWGKKKVGYRMLINLEPEKEANKPVGE